MLRENGQNRTGLIVAANACMFVFGVVLLLMGSLLPSLQVNYLQAGNLGSFPLAGILLATILVGPILDRAGAKYVLALALALIAVSLATMSLVHSYRPLASAAFTYGMGGGLLNTATNALVSDLNFSGRAAALNLLGFSFSLGAISAPLAMSVGGNWSPSLVLRLMAVLTGVVLVPVLLLRFPAATRTGTRIGTLLSVLKQPTVWLFGVVLFFESGSENCMFVWSGKIVADVLHTTPQRANLALVGLSGALGVGRLMAVFWLRRLGGRTTILVSAATTVVGALFVSTSHEFIPMIAGIMVIGLGLSSIFPTALGLAGDCFPRETGTVFGAIMAVALVGGTAGPSVAAQLASHSPNDVLWLPIISAVMVAVLTVLVGRLKCEWISKPVAHAER